MNHDYNALLTGFIYNIQSNGNEFRLNLIKQILNVEVINTIKNKFITNEFKDTWKPYHRNQYPLVINFKQLAITSTIMLFVEYLVKLILSASSGVSKVVQNIAINVHTLYENSSQSIDFVVQHTFQNEQELLFFFQNTLTGIWSDKNMTIKKNSKGSIQTLHNILFSTRVIKKKYIDSNGNIEKDIITHIIMMAIGKQKAQEKHWRRDTSATNIFQPSIHKKHILRVVKKAVKKHRKNRQKNQIQSEQKTQEFIPQHHQEALQTLNAMGYSQDAIDSVYQTLLHEEQICFHYTDKKNVIELCLNELNF
eukprot:300127_1